MTVQDASKKILTFWQLIIVVISIVSSGYAAFSKMNDALDSIESLEKSQLEMKHSISAFEESMKKAIIYNNVYESREVLMLTFGYPQMIEESQMRPEMERWFNESWGIQLRSLSVLCRQDPKTLILMLSRLDAHWACRKLNEPIYQSVAKVEIL